MALTLQPTPLWLTIRDNIPRVKWSQAAFERDWSLLLVFLGINIVGLFMARMDGMSEGAIKAQQARRVEILKNEVQKFRKEIQKIEDAPAPPRDRPWWKIW